MYKNISKGVINIKSIIKFHFIKYISESTNKNAYKTASACMRPITDGICPESLLPCNDLPVSKKDLSQNSLRRDEIDQISFLLKIT